MSVEAPEAPKFEFDGEGYPTEASLAAWQALGPFDVGPAAAARFLVEVLPTLEEGLGGYASITIEEHIDCIDRLVRTITYTTGGWSGAEDIINVILKQFWVRRFHTMWKRGGLFQFEVPQAVLDQASAASNLTTPNNLATPSTSEPAKRDGD